MTSCSNFGINSAGTSDCSCPVGWGGTDCTSLACANPILPRSSRPLFDSTLSGSAGSLGCGNQCDDGFGGPLCNVCETTDACRAAVGSSGSSTATATGAAATSSQGLGSGLGGGSGSAASDVTCDTGRWTWTEGFLSCSVVNPTLQSVFSGATTLSIQKTVRPELSLSSPFGANGTTQVQLLYASSTSSIITEQFYCKADSCVQTRSEASIDWECQNLQCLCIPGTTFCGNGGALDLTPIINTLSGALAISCSTSDATCNFKQSALNSLFGNQGLALSGCSSGECVRTSTRAAIESQLDSSAGKGGAGLSSGVIGGLAVLGVLAGVILALVVWGCVKQRKARRGRVVMMEKGVEGVGIRWRNVGYSLASSEEIAGIVRRRRGSSVDDGRVILDGLSGEVGAGKLCAVLGPTGAGKSSFVDLLAGKRKSGRKSGTVELVLPPGAAGERVKIGYVDQNDVLPATSTAREALMFAAELKLGEGVSKEDKSARVFEVLKLLGLLDVADSMIGSGTKRGISGGEKRRLSIGLELLAAPAILIADEPTSGLDSVSAARVVQVLKTLANSDSGQRTTVITTIHQPSSQIYHLFDTVMVLGVGGRQIYFGPAQDANTFFAARGKPCPPGWNPADHLLELASIANASSTPPSPVDPSASTLERPESARGSLPESSAKDEQGSTVPVLSKYPPAEGDLGTRESTPSTTILTQFETLAGREYRNLKRDWSLVIMHNLVAIFVGLFVGGLYYQVDLTIGGFQSRIGSLFFLGSLLAFSSLSALSNFVTVKELFQRERAGAYYGPFAWCLSRVAFDIIPLRILPTIIMSCIVYWMVGLSPTAASFFKFLLILVEFNIATTLLNLLLAAAIYDSGIAILVSAVLNLFQMAYAGFFVNLASIPAVLRWLQWISPLKYTLEALAVNEVASGLLIQDTLAGVKVEISAAIIMQTLFGFTPTAYYRDVLVLFAFVGGFGSLLVLAVIFKLRERR